MWQAGTESKQWKFDRVMKEIQERNADAYIYLMKLDPEKWTLLHGGDHRHGIMRTNISEALNSVLKKARCVEKMGQGQIHMYRRYIRDKCTKEFFTKRIFILSSVRTFGGMFLLV
ncbi:hypothetical protein M9H77_04663 [Catharanthus roseus]|uniref:Uncharacterized protein n=1 Tax=Catharanthus roseus TaxID=4058 RepID=A0ACC0CET9_CATRO|nr:hypothetical protein M9H77_04663 [Catharanthus roseus]